MIAQPFQYVAAGTIDEARKVLDSVAGARPLAGGHWLLPDLKTGARSAPMLVDLRTIPGLRESGSSNGDVRVGALATLAELITAQVPRVLAEATAHIADPQARNRATVAGTLAASDRNGRLGAALLALGARAAVAGSSDTQSPEQLIGRDKGYLITSVLIPRGPVAGAWEELVERAGRRLVAGVALAADPRGGWRVAVTGTGLAPRRIPELEEDLSAGKDPRPLPAGAFPADGTVSAAYRAHVTTVLATRAFARARGLQK